MKCKHCGTKNNWRCRVYQTCDVDIDKNEDLNVGIDFSDPELEEETLHCGYCGEWIEPEPLTIPVYYREEKGKKIVDEDSMRDYLENRLQNLEDRLNVKIVRR
jgi:hypothetical protein